MAARKSSSNNDETYWTDKLVAALSDSFSPDIRGAEEALKHGANANVRLLDGRLLIDTVREKVLDKQLLVLLMNHGADMNSVCEVEDGCAPLHRAVQMGRHDLVLTMLKSGKVDPNLMSADSMCRLTPLQLALKRDGKDVSMARILLNHGASVRSITRTGETLLHFADCRIMICLLVGRGLDPNKVGYKYGATPLHQACRRNKLQIAKSLVRYGADVNATAACSWLDEDYVTPLHMASFYGHVEIIDWLVNHCAANLATRSDKGKSALEFACQGDASMESIYWILDHNWWSKTAITQALAAFCSRDHVRDRSTVDLIVLVHSCRRHSPDLHKLPGPLHSAAPWDVDTCHLLVDHVRCGYMQLGKGPDHDRFCHWRYHNDDTRLELPIHVAARGFQIDPLKFFVGLMEKDNQSLDVRDSKGATPLMSATRRGLVNHVRFLLDRGCDVNSIDCSGRSVVHELVDFMVRQQAVDVVNTGFALPGRS